MEPSQNSIRIEAIVSFPWHCRIFLIRSVTVIVLCLQEFWVRSITSKTSYSCMPCWWYDEDDESETDREDESDEWLR